MLIDVTRTLKQLNGEPLRDNDGQGNAVEATVKMALINGILSPVKDDTGVQKVQKYELARKMYKAESTVDLTVEEIVMLKRRVEELYPPLVCGQLLAILEGKE